MANAKRWPFDVPVEGVGERYMTMGELVRAAQACKDTDPEAANEMFAYAVQSGSAAAKLAYSKFLRNTPKLAMPQTERYQKAEDMLLELLNLLDVSDRFAAETALELGTLYADCLQRPVGALSLFLYARRLGANAEDTRLKALHRKMDKMDLNQLGNSVDALRLGRELCRSGRTTKLTELFLREAVDKAAQELSAGRRGAKNLYGQACLALGDFYSSKLRKCAAHERPAYRIERDKMYVEARKNGHPEYLTRCNLA